MENVLVTSWMRPDRAFYWIEVELIDRLAGYFAARIVSDSGVMLSAVDSTALISIAPQFDTIRWTRLSVRSVVVLV